MNYKFICIDESTHTELVNEEYEYFGDFEEENGVHRWGEAVLEFPYIDIELNLLADWHGEKPLNKPYPCYFICSKGNTNWGSDEWISQGYIDGIDGKYDVHVDWKAANWKEQLEKEMLDTLLRFVNDFGQKLYEPNFEPGNEWELSVKIDKALEEAI